MHIVKRQLPTLKNIHQQLKTDINFKGGITSLRDIIIKMGFKWGKTQNNRNLLVEKPEIVLKRISYLRSISNYRTEGRPIIYMDETYIHSTHARSMNWSDSTNEGFKAPISKGSRFIIVHAGGVNGFVPNALLMFKSQQKTGDYHDDMNFENYEKWLREHLIPNLPARTVLVIDNAPYHNKVNNLTPMSNSRKQVMKDWLTEKGIQFTMPLLKPELYKLILLNKPRFKEYKIDHLLKEFGHTALRLPPYHPDLNPIENIWALIKGYVASFNVDLTLASVKKLVEEKVADISVDQWKNLCEHAINVENNHWSTDIAIDTILDDANLIITPSFESSSEDDEDEDSD